jgi:hypothetical protein
MMWLLALLALAMVGFFTVEMRRLADEEAASKAAHRLAMKRLNELKAHEVQLPRLVPEGYAPRYSAPPVPNYCTGCGMPRYPLRKLAVVAGETVWMCAHCEGGTGCEASS